MALTHFLLVFDHVNGELRRQDSFHESRKAIAAYTDCERQYRDDPMIEIVLIGSDSIETVKLTHANYFDGSVAVSKYLADLPK